MKALGFWLVLAALTAPQARAAEPAPGRRLVLSGTATRQAKPDFASVSIGVTNKAATTAAAIDATSVAATRILTAARAFGIEPRDLQTSYVSLEPAYRTVRDASGGTERRPDGYTASNTVTIRLRQLDRLGEFLRGVVDGGANQIGGIEFELADPGKLEREALAAAVKDARTQADIIAQAAGVRLGRIEEIRTGERARSPRPSASEPGTGGRGASPTDSRRGGIARRVGRSAGRVRTGAAPDMRPTSRNRVWMVACAAGAFASFGVVGPGQAAGGGAEEAWQLWLPASSQPVPSLLSSGPYGNPFATGPALRQIDRDLWANRDPTVIGIGGETGAARSDRREILPGLPTNPGVARAIDPDKDDGLPALPGTFKRIQTQIPGALQKGKVVAPHLTPDVALPISPRTTVGVFGEVGRVEVDTRNGLIPSVKTHDLGAGVSLQYRFGQ